MIRPVTILLAEDHAIVREGLRSLLAFSRDFVVVGEASNGREAVKLARKLRPAVAVVDIAMPVLNGFEATRQIKLVSPETRVLVLSAHSDDEYVVHMAALGASGYLVKQNTGQVLARAIREIAEGRPFFSDSILKRMRDRERRARDHGVARSKHAWPLTSREAEVFQLIVEGCPNKGIATELGISIKTVEKHRQSLMDKLNIHDTAGLTRYAIATGVIESSIQATVE